MQESFERCLQDSDSDSSSKDSTSIDYDALVSPEAVDDLWRVWTSIYRTSTSGSSADRGPIVDADDR